MAMKVPSPMDRRMKWLLVFILGFSVLIRITAALILGNQVEVLPGTFDQISYHNLALRVLDGHGFTFDQPWWPGTPAGEPTAHWSYLYTLYLVGVYALFDASPVVARVIQAFMVGILHPLLVFLIARRVFNPTVGLIAAGLTAVYIYFIYYSGALMTESTYITVVLAILYLAMILSDKLRVNALLDERFPLSMKQAAIFKTVSIAVTLGVCLGLAVLLRQVILIFVPILFLWMWWSGRRHHTWAILLSGLVLVAMILPVSLFNYFRFDRFVLVNTNAGFAFYWANHPVYGNYFEPILPSGEYFRLLPDELQHLNEAAKDQALLWRGLDFIFQDPIRYLNLSLSRIPAFFMFWPSPESTLISNVSRVASFGLMLPLMVYGLVAILFNHRVWIDGRLKSPAMLLYLFFFFYTLIHLLSWALIRYRLPVDAVMLVFAGWAVVDIHQKLSTRQRYKLEQANHL
jgi:4-amino-4-deoxy-L-arabinose transferase-like glycosyltransferase